MEAEERSFEEGFKEEIENRPERLIEAYIKEAEAKARGWLVLLSSSKVIKRFGIKSPSLKARNAQLLPKVAERYGYASFSKRGGYRRVYVKILSKRRVLRVGTVKL